MLNYRQKLLYYDTPFEVPAELVTGDLDTAIEVLLPIAKQIDQERLQSGEVFSKNLVTQKSSQCNRAYKDAKKRLIELYNRNKRTFSKNNNDFVFENERLITKTYSNLYDLSPDIKHLWNVIKHGIKRQSPEYKEQAGRILGLSVLSAGAFLAAMQDTLGLKWMTIYESVSDIPFLGPLCATIGLAIPLAVVGTIYGGSKIIELLKNQQARQAMFKLAELYNGVIEYILSGCDLFFYEYESNASSEIKKRVRSLVKQQYHQDIHMRFNQDTDFVTASIDDINYTYFLNHRLDGLLSLLILAPELLHVKVYRNTIKFGKKDTDLIFGCQLKGYIMRLSIFYILYDHGIVKTKNISEFDSRLQSIAASALEVKNGMVFVKSEEIARALYR